MAEINLFVRDVSAKNLLINIIRKYCKNYTLAELMVKVKNGLPIFSVDLNKNRNEAFPIMIGIVDELELAGIPYELIK